jgi:hypothetical protein
LARQIAVTEGAAQRRVVSEGAGRQRRLREHGRVVEHGARELGAVERQRDRAAQRHFLGRHAADQRVLHVEVGQNDVGHRRAHQPHLALRQKWRDLAAGGDQCRHLVGHAHEVLVAAGKAQPARLAFVDDADLHPINERQAPAAQALGVARQQRLRGEQLGRDGKVPAPLAILRIAFEHDARRTLP